MHLDNTCRCTIWILGSPVWSWELDSMILEGIFLLSIYYDSMILSCSMDRRGQSAWEHEVRVSGSRMKDLIFFTPLSWRTDGTRKPLPSTHTYTVLWHLLPTLLPLTKKKKRQKKPTTIKQKPCPNIRPVTTQNYFMCHKTKKSVRWEKCNKSTLKIIFFSSKHLNADT